MLEATMLYKHPGQHSFDGGTFDYIIVDASDIPKAVADGWRLTTIEALTLEADVVDNSAPTRAELEQKATELGLKFDGRTSDKKLSLAIDEALASSPDVMV